MFARDKKVFRAAVNSETALNVAGDCLTHNEWLRVKDLVDKGVASVAVTNGVLAINYDWSKAEDLGRQVEMDF